jgi:phosphatidylserine decarboxylase
MRIVREGWPFILGCLVASDLFLAGAIVLKSGVLTGFALVLFLASLFCVYFFRDPVRVIPSGEKMLLSPADGKILEIVEGQDPVANGPVWVLRIFLSVFNAHLQRSPVAGRVKRIEYKKGKFLDARDPKAPFENEQNRIEIDPSPPAPLPEGEGGRRPGEGTIVVTQIAGLIARRIVCWVKEGQKVEAGERIGLIRFGSQVDVVMPQNARLRVKAGDIVTAGDTVLADL